MANEIQVAAQATLGALPAAVRARMQPGVKPNSDLSAGITTGFAIVSVRGKVFRIKHQGEERNVTNPDGTPAGSLDVVIVKASPHIAKIFYIDGYEEGSTQPPDCFSVNGVRPDPASPKRQSETCAGCPQNAWGSASRNGRQSKGKACQDSKRLGVVPAGNIPNDMYNGPMLTRVPPDSLSELVKYAERLNMMGFPVDAVVTRITFDIDTPHPKMLFKEVRALSDAEYEQVEKLQKGEVIDRILNTAVDHVQTDGDPSAPAHPGVGQTGGKPMQAGEKPPANFTPQVVGGTATPQAAGMPSPAPAAVTPAQASQERVAEVEQKAAAPVDPNAKKRADLRALGFPEEQIIALCGEEPKAQAAPVDPRIEKLKAAGLSDAEIATLLAAPVTPQGNGASAAPANGQRKRRTKAEMEAARAAEAAAKAGQAQPQPAQNPPQQAAGGGFAAQPEQPLTGEVLPPDSEDEPKTGDLPPDFASKLDALLGTTP